MRRLVGLAVLFVVLCVSVPSYGVVSSNYFLIYNVSCTVKGANNSNKASIPWKAYCVVKLDGSDSLVDVNLIMYGKDSTKAKVYVELDYHATGSYYLDEDLWWQGDFVVLDFWDYTDPFDFEGLVTGLSAPKDIGLGTTQKKWVASSLTGPMTAYGSMLFDQYDYIAGGGIISASLDLKTTKLVNANGWTQENIIETGGDIAGKHQKSLIERLAGYSAAVLP
jgi:hypothetical protein